MTKTSRKPNRRTINRLARETAGHLRELVAAFCRARGGVEVRPRMVSTVDFGTFGADWQVPTPVGLWVVHEPSDPATGLLSINTRFENPELLTAVIAGKPHVALDFNHYSGKWNHHAEVMATNDPESFAQSFLLDLQHRSAFLFPSPAGSDESDPASCDERVAPGVLADGDGARGLGAARDEVRGERRVPSARVAGDDQDRVLSEDVADVGGEALRLGGKRRASTAIVLRPKDVEGQAGLTLAEKDTRGRRHGVAGEVAVRGRRNGRRGLLRVDGAAQRRAGQRAALPEADHDADLARGDGAPEGSTAEGHVLSVIQERRVLKKWAAPNYVLIWFDRSDAAHVRVTLEHVDPLRAKFLVRSGWRETKAGCYSRAVSCTELASTLAMVGRVITAESVTKPDLDHY